MSGLPFSGSAIRAMPEDIANAAAAAGIETATLLAVIEVETGGAGGFLADHSGRPRILFEAHVFGRLTGHRWTREHPDLSSHQWDRGLYRGGAAEYERLERAVALDRDAALKATSWGLFQIMGFNHAAAGYRTVEEFVAAMAESEANHLRAFLRFVEGPMLDALRRRDWREFARRYNGPAAELNDYAGKMARAYLRAIGGRQDAETEEGQPVLRLGSRGDAVRRLQDLLNRQAEPAGLTVDGIYGRATEAAVTRFQRKAGLTPDGVTGSRTWRALATAEAAPAAAEDRPPPPPAPPEPETERRPPPRDAAPPAAEPAQPPPSPQAERTAAMPLPIAALAPLAVSLLPQAASAIGSLFGGERAASAAEQFGRVAQAVLATDDPEAARRLLAAEPERAAALRVELERLLAEHAIAAAREENEARRLANADTADARAMAVAVERAGGSNRMRDLVAVASIGIFVLSAAGCLLAVMISETQVVVAMAGAILGATTVGFQSVIGYFLGSSAGSAAKDIRLAATQHR